MIKDTLQQWPSTDSIYVGYDDGAWLQVQRLDGMDADQRSRLHAPANAAFGICADTAQSVGRTTDPPRF